MCKIKLVSGKGRSGNGKAEKVKVEKPTAKKKSKAPVIIIIIVLILVAAVAGMGIYVKELDTVFPNVSLGGVDISKMTVADAEAALIASGYEQNAANVSATIVFPNDTEMVITGEDAGMALKASVAAKEAAEYGKEGSFFSNIISYVKTFFTHVELLDENVAKINEEYVLSVVEEYTEKFNGTLLSSSYEIKKYSILITNSSGGELANAEDVYKLTTETLFKALANSRPETAEYKLGEGKHDEVDLVAIFNIVNVEPVSAVYDSETQSVTESVTGVSFDMDDAKNKLAKAEGGERVQVPLIFTEPEVTTAALEAMIFRDIISERTTDIAGTSNRLNNIVIAAEAVNGLILSPGDTFSFNETVGPRTSARGYLSAGAYVGGKTVQETGGGICQVSSTLYDCVLYADLEVVERRPHMFTVPYLPLGNDATIAWGAIDFKFKNDTDYPIKIETHIEGRKITVKLHGTKLDENYVEIKYVVLGTTAFTIEYEEDETIEPGKQKIDESGSNGCAVETYKYIYDKDGNELSKTYIAKSSYRPHNRLILVPVGTLDEEGKPLPPEEITPPPTDPGGETTSPPSTDPNEGTEGPPHADPDDDDTTSPPPTDPPGDEDADKPVA